MKMQNVTSPLRRTGSFVLAISLVGACYSGPAFAQAGDVKAAAEAYGLAKTVIGDIANLTKGPSQCVRHFYNKSNAVWFVSGGSLGDGDGAQYAVSPGQTVPVYYNGNGGALDIHGPGSHDMFKVDGCYLDHNGNTGRAVLNDPADGDIQFIN